MGSPNINFIILNTNRLPFLQWFLEYIDRLANNDPYEGRISQHQSVKFSSAVCKYMQIYANICKHSILLWALAVGQWIHLPSEHNCYCSRTSQAGLQSWAAVDFRHCLLPDRWACWGKLWAAGWASNSITPCREWALLKAPTSLLETCVLVGEGKKSQEFPTSGAGAGTGKGRSLRRAIQPPCNIRNELGFGFWRVKDDTIVRKTIGSRGPTGFSLQNLMANIPLS